jgi:hypothetical protein
MAAVPGQNGALQGALLSQLQNRDLEGLDEAGDYSAQVLASNSFALQASSSVGTISTGDDQNLFANICAAVLDNRVITVVNNTPGSTNPYYPWCQAAAAAYGVAALLITGAGPAQYGALIGAAQAVLAERDLTGLTAAGDYSAPFAAANSFAMQVANSVGSVSAGDNEILLTNIVAGAMYGRSISVVGGSVGVDNIYYPLSQAIDTVYDAAVGNLGGTASTNGAYQGAMQGMLTSRDITGLTAAGDYSVIIAAALAFAEEVTTVGVSVSTADQQALLANICAAVTFGRPFTDPTEATYTASATAAIEAYTVAVAYLTS